MAKQLNVLRGQVIPTALHTEMQQSYLEYAMSVIVGRALPDVRDGLKPVHRRILYAMHELGLTPDRPFRKCARVVGDVLGKYHPHGDQAVYDALVRLVQDFSSRYPVLAGHGNFGSLDADPPAAMRYTETRLAPIGNQALLTDIGEATVEFSQNFDNSQQEPTVLPAQLPFLLLNGSSGIAVGMATNIPPHNLGEIVDGLIALIDRPYLPDEDLMELIPGPDFPTGGTIYGQEGIWDAYQTGRGSIVVRGVTQLEEIHLGKGRHRRNAIVITELPYQVNKASLIEKIADLVNQGKVEGIADIRDESDREGIRVVIELRRDANPDKLLEKLYRLTPLQTTFGAIFLALCDNQPRQLSLRQVLQEFLTFREATLTRLYQHDLEQHQHRLHLVEGWLSALEHLDAVIEILRHAPDGSTAKLQFQEQFDLSAAQADAILAMPLRRLTGLERQNLQQEFEELRRKIAELQTLLSDRRELLKALKKELRSLKKQFADPRKTQIIDAPTTAKRVTRSSTPPPAVQTVEDAPQIERHQPQPQAEVIPAPDSTVAPSSSVEPPRSSDRSPRSQPASAQPLTLIPDEPDGEPTVLEITTTGWVRRLPPEVYGDAEIPPVNGVIQQTESAVIGQSLIVITDSGRAFPLPVKSIPRIEQQAAGVALTSLLPGSAQGDRMLVSVRLSKDLDDQFILLLTQQGRIKRLPLGEMADITNRGLSLIKLKEDDRLALVGFANSGDQVVIGTSMGRLLRLEVNDHLLPLSHRAATGGQVLRLLKSERLVGMAVTGTIDPVLLVSAQGWAKRVTTRAIKLCQPGDLGTYWFQFSQRSDSVVGLTTAFPEDMVTLCTSQERAVEVCVDVAPLANREHKGQMVLEMQPDEAIQQAIVPQLMAEVENPVS
jgi:DNA gyrase subunit A